MIKILTLLITFTASLSFSADMPFEEQKKRTLGFIEERAATLAAHKACVEKSTNQESLRECNKSQRMSAMKQRQNLMEEKKDK